MIAVDQTTFGLGTCNCFSACVASLLELPVDDVPFFMGAEDWLTALNTWLAPRGLYAVVAALVGNTWRPPGLYILGGESPRGPHAVIAHGADVVHDPHPSRAGLVSHEDATLLVPLNPAAHAHKNEPPAMGSPAARTTAERTAVGCP